MTFNVDAERFRVRLETTAQVLAAEAARDGFGPAIPVGRLVAGTQVNVATRGTSRTSRSPM